jgi:hypothetical protein
LVSPGPYDVLRPAGIQPTHLPAAEASGVPPWTFTPLQSSSPGTRAVPPVARLVRRHFLSWTSLALRHSPRPAASCLGSGSLRRPGRVRGLDTSCATRTTDPPDACASERPWASPFKGFPSLQSVPLSGPLPSCRYQPPASLDERRRATQPASGPCSCNESVLSPESRMTPVADPFLGFDPPELAPIRPGARFVSRRLPSRPWAA